MFVTSKHRHLYFLQKQLLVMFAHCSLNGYNSGITMYYSLPTVHGH